MRGRLWLQSFIEIVRENSDLPDIKSNVAWTQSMGIIMDKVGGKLGCEVIRKRPCEDNGTRCDDKGTRGECFTIDVTFFDKVDWEQERSVLPKVVVESENRKDRKQIEHSLWKTLCIRSSVRVVICFQHDGDKVKELIKHLEGIVSDQKLMEEDKGSLFVIIGDESIADNDDWSWGEFFKVYEWRGDAFRKLRRLNW